MRPPGPPRYAPTTGCSRSRRPGSIAASAVSSASGRVTRPVPGHVDRAPLRLEDEQTLHAALLLCSRSRRPGSIAAQIFGRRQYCETVLLFPVTSTGLHCGVETRREPNWTPGLFPVTSTGLHCGGSESVHFWKTKQAVPGHVDRAPLRLVPVPVPVVVLHRLFPVTSTGLHCGTMSSGTSAMPPVTVPGHVDRAPLRRAPACAVRRPGVWPVPGHVDRAPLRPGPEVRHLGRRRRCSRSRRPGSIAARAVVLVWRSGSCGCSRSRRPGSIAAMSAPPRLRGLAAGLFPVTSTGLHCGCNRLLAHSETAPLFPVTSTGLHCGGSLFGDYINPQNACSRSRRPGSIAAHSRSWWQ